MYVKTIAAIYSPQMDGYAFWLQVIHSFRYLQCTDIINVIYGKYAILNNFRVLEAVGRSILLPIFHASK